MVAYTITLTEDENIFGSQPCGKHVTSIPFSYLARVDIDNPVRLMDAFIDKLDLSKLGFINTVHKSEGRPPYAAAVLLKGPLYISNSSSLFLLFVFVIIFPSFRFIY